VTGVDWYKDGGQSLRGMLGSRISGLDPGDEPVLGLSWAVFRVWGLESLFGRGVNYLLFGGSCSGIAVKSEV
jgi:hypothetical protein